MKTLVRKITAYKYAELSKDAQEKAKQNYLAEDRSPNFFSADLTGELKERFGLYNLKTCYSLSYCQGDGLCLYGQIEHPELFSNEKFRGIAFKGIHHRQIQSIYDELQQIDFIHRSRYCFAQTVSIESMEYSPIPIDKQEAIIEKIIGNVKSWYFEFCREWENRGYDYFYELTDSDMQEICEEKEYLFTQDGQLIDMGLYSEQTA
jgi:hypothetical protein